VLGKLSSAPLGIILAKNTIDIAEQSYSQDETLDVSFDCDPTEWRK
jgi:hypothetical protein